LGDRYSTKCRYDVHDISIQGMLFAVGVDTTRIVDYHSIFRLKVDLHDTVTQFQLFPDTLAQLLELSQFRNFCVDGFQIE